MLISIIVARSINHVIGKEGKLPWHLPKDMQHFMRTTYGHHVIMGRKTFESLPKPLLGRKVIVLSHNPNYQAGNGVVAPNLKEALGIAKEAGETEVFIAGGSAIYQEALVIADKIYLTLVGTAIKGDAFFPVLENHNWMEINRIDHSPDENHAYGYSFIELVRRR